MTPTVTFRVSVHFTGQTSGSMNIEIEAEDITAAMSLARDFVSRVMRTVDGSWLTEVIISDVSEEAF